MPRYGRYFQLDPAALLPFNDAPRYLRGSVVTDDSDSLVISGTAEYYDHDWENIGARSGVLSPHSFSFAVRAFPKKDVGAYSIGIVEMDDDGELARHPRINLSHFLRNANDLVDPIIGKNFYSGFGFNDSGRRTQVSIPARWDSVNHSHSLRVEYSESDEMLRCFAEDMQIHGVPGTLGKFCLEIRFESVAVPGEFHVEFEDLRYSPVDDSGLANVHCLNGWDTQYPPVFLSYSHNDSHAAADFRASLRDKFVRVLGDWDLQVGDSLIGKLERSISKAGYVLVLLTPSSVASTWVKKELSIAMADQLESPGRKRVLPILLEDCELTAFLRGVIYLDFRSNRANAMDRLLQELKKFGAW